MEEEVIWEGRASWRAWAGTWILGWILLPVLIGAYFLISIWMRTKAQRWKVTSRRIERESGLLSKRVDTIELWRIRDVEYRQSIFDRMFGVSSLVVTAQDGAAPYLEIRGVPASRVVYDGLMSAVMTARQQRGVMNLNQ
jgi:uncharacterized membrane protein YdbT with pleckstrin-like domain